MVPNNALMQVYHAEDKVEPFTLRSLINMWKLSEYGAVSTSDAKVEETDSSSNFLSDVSDELCSQLHSGIIKAARRVLLDEIVSNIILDFIALRKAHKHSKPEATYQSAETSSSNGKVVMNKIFFEGKLLLLLHLHMCCFVDRLKVPIA